MQSSIRLFSVLAIGLVVAPFVVAERYSVRRDTVVPVRFETEIRLSETRRDDTFSARVEDGREFPRGTRLLGRVVDVERRSGQAAAQLEFNQAILPNGQRVGIRAVPVSLEGSQVRRDRDGRLVAQRKKNNEGAFWTSLGVGTVLGALVEKPFEGAFLGALAGIVIAETNGFEAESGGVIVKRGAKMGALLERDVRFEFSAEDRDDREDRWADRWSDAGLDDRRGGDSDRWDEDFPTFRAMGRELRFTQEEPPIRQGELWLVPLDRAARQVGLTVEVTRTDRRWLIESEETTIVLELDSDQIRRNGRTERIEGRVIRREGVVYVPATLFDKF